MIAHDLMTHAPSCVRPGDNIGDAAALMGASDIGAVPVVDGDDGGRLVGMLTDRDIAIRCTAKHHDPGKCSVEDHMTRGDLITVNPHTPLREVVERMERAQVRRVPVVELDGRLVGVIAQADLARHAGPDDPRLLEELLARVSAPAETGMPMN